MEENAFWLWLRYVGIDTLTGGSWLAALAHCSLLINYSFLRVLLLLRIVCTRTQLNSTRILIGGVAVNIIASTFRFPIVVAFPTNYLHFHRVRVHLAHVLASVLHLDASDHQGPGIKVAVRHRQPVIVRYHVLVDRQNRFGVRFNPGHLHTRMMTTTMRYTTRGAQQQQQQQQQEECAASWKDRFALFMNPRGKLDFNMYIYWWIYVLCALSALVLWCCYSQRIHMYNL